MTAADQRGTRADSEAERPDDAVSDFSRRVDDWGDSVARWVARAAARAREEAEDIWAEAQSIRRR